MPVRQSAAPTTRDKSPPPPAATPAPSWTPKASAVASTSEPTAPAAAKTKKKRKKKAEPTADRRQKPKARDGEAATGEAATTAPVAMVTDAGAAALRPYRGKCLYQSRKCENERALKRNGLPHNLCEEHRSKQNQHQRKFDAKKFSRKRRSGSDGELEGDDSEPAPHDKKRPRAPTPQQQQQQPVPVPVPVPAANPRVAIPPRVAAFAPTSASMVAAPQLVSLALPTAHALYAGSAAPMANNFRVGMPASPALGHRIVASQLPIPGVSHHEYQRIHTQDGRQPSTTPRLLPPQQLDGFASRAAAGYSLSELEAARILVPTSMAASSGAPAAYTDARAAYQQSHPYQQQQQHEYYQQQQQQQQQPAIRRTASMPDPARGDRPMMFRPQGDVRPADPSPRVLPPLLRPPPTPTPTFAHIDAPQPHSFAPGINTSAAPSLTLRSPLLSAASAPLPTMPRLSSLGSTSMPSVTTSEALPSLAPFRVRRSPLPPATSQ